MKIPPLAEAIKRLCARDPRYAPEAYQFLLDGLQETVRQIHEKEKAPRHVTGAELAEGLRRHALAQFGPLAMTVLNRWGVRTTRDFGEIVFAMLEAGLLGKTPDDKIEDFDNIYDFDRFFRAPYRPRRSRPPRKKPDPQASPAAGPPGG